MFLIYKLIIPLIIRCPLFLLEGMTLTDESQEFQDVVP